MIDHENKLIFVHGIKRAGTSIEKALISAGGTLETEEVLWSLHMIHRYFPETKDYTVFTVARNPWDWLVSWHRWINRQSPENLCDLTGAELVGDDFCEKVFDWQLRNRKTPQSLTSLTGSRPFRWVHALTSRPIAGEMVVLRFDHLAEDWARFRELFAPGLPELLELNTAPEPFDYPDAYTPERVDLVMELYADDIDAFGWEYPKLVGDFIARTTKRLGMKRCGSCESRRQKLNTFQRRL